MQALRRIAFAALSALAFLSSSCGINSQNPLSDPNRSKPDADLFGTWVTKDEKGTILWVIGRAQENAQRDDVPGGFMRAVGSSLDENHLVPKPGHFAFFVTALGQDRYLNVFDDNRLDKEKHPQWNEPPVENFHLLKYRLVGNRLNIWQGDIDKAGDAVDAGLVKGVVHRQQKGKRVSSVQLTDTTERLDRFLRTDVGKAVFPEMKPLVLDRLRIP